MTILYASIATGIYAFIIGFGLSAQRATTILWKRECSLWEAVHPPDEITAAVIAELRAMEKEILSIRHKRS